MPGGLSDFSLFHLLGYHCFSLLFFVSYSTQCPLSGLREVILAFAVKRGKLNAMELNRVLPAVAPKQHVRLGHLQFLDGED